MPDDDQPTTDESIVEGIEETDDEGPLDIPVDRRRVKTDKRDLPVETLHQWINRGKLNLQPEFQRQFVWNHKKASRLIESLLLEIPIPVIYVAEDPDGKMPVVDGQQRLTSIHSFINGTFPDGSPFKLRNLQVLTELNGVGFKDLSGTHQEAVMSAMLRFIVILRDSDPDVKFEVFERLNLGADRLNDQELRNSVYRGSYNQLLKELAGNPNMLKVMRASKPHKRMADRQLILRFFAMWRKTHLKYKQPIKQFMNREMYDNRYIQESGVAEMRQAFENAIDMAVTVFGDNAFRRFYPPNAVAMEGYWEASKMNLALWDTILYTFTFFEKRQIIPIADRIREEFLDLLTTDTLFNEYIGTSNDQGERVKYRADEWRRRMDSLVKDSKPEARGFTLELKKALYDANPTCQICGNHIHHLDGSEVDHVLHYWRGGHTIPENARLTHRYCNRSRGGRD